MSRPAFCLKKPDDRIRDPSVPAAVPAMAAGDRRPAFLSSASAVLALFQAVFWVNIAPAQISNMAAAP